jgi:hypothetical protein
MENKKIKCECGSIINKTYFKKHIKTFSHIKHTVCISID